MVVGFVQAELGKYRVLANEVGDGAVELGDDLGQCLSRGLGFEVFDGVELDTTLLKDLQSVRRRVSMRVVEQRD